MNNPLILNENQDIKKKSKYNRIMKNLYLTITLTLLVLTVNAQSALEDPQIPQGETIRYRNTQKDKQEFSYQIVNFVNLEGQEYYLVENQSVEEISKSRILKDIFLPVYIEKHHYAGRAESVSTKELLSIPELQKEELGILDMTDMAFLLRGYPFDKPQDMFMTLLDQKPEDSAGMTFKVIFRGKDNVTIDGKDYKAYKLEMKADLEGAMSLFSGMIPKTYLWYDQQGSHTLLKFTGSGGPGTDEMLMEMVDYNY
jgi:hypothetical protein